MHLLQIGSELESAWSRQGGSCPPWPCIQPSSHPGVHLRLALSGSSHSGSSGHIQRFNPSAGPAELADPPPPPQQPPWGKGWGHLLDFRHCVLFWEPSFTLGDQKLLIVVTFFFLLFLPTYMAGNISFHKTKFLALRYVDSECHLPYQ